MEIETEMQFEYPEGCKTISIIFGALDINSRIHR